MKHYTHTIWNLDYNEDSGEIEWMYCGEGSGWNGVHVTPEQAKVMEEEFLRTGRTSWTGTDSHIDFVRGPSPEFDMDTSTLWDEVKLSLDTDKS